MDYLGYSNLLKTSDGTAIVPLNSMFLNCTYANFYWDFENARIHDIHTDVFRKCFGHGVFYFEVEKISHTEFSVKVERVHLFPDKVPDNGYYLELIVTVIGYNGRPKVKLMDSMTDCVSDVYNYNSMDDDRIESNIWTIQCVMHMHEISLLLNDATKAQNEIMSSLEKEEIYRKNIPHMAFLLKRESLNDVFSGRQDYEFALLKKGFIERTLIFADMIAEKIKAKESNTEFKTLMSSDVYLCYILKNDLKPINKREVLNLYTLAYHLGLTYLVMECRDFMLRNLDLEFLVDVIEHSVNICDFNLMVKVIPLFIRNMDQMVQTKNWKYLLSNKFPTARCIFHIAQRQHFHIGKCFYF